MVYCVDTVARKRTSLQTMDEDRARQIVEAKNLAQRQPEINLQIAKAYLAAADSNFVKRTWCEVRAEFVKTKIGSNRTRSERAIKDRAFDSIRDLQLVETRSEHFLRVLGSRKVSTNNYLRRFHIFAVDMGWLLWPVLPKRQWPMTPKRQWPPLRYKEKWAITREEYDLILSRETACQPCLYLASRQLFLYRSAFNFFNVSSLVMVIHIDATKKNQIYFLEDTERQSSNGRSGQVNF